ncbi:unnamed protein product [Adineta ricciae]|uniref:MULE transposase domain-containing protein n=1 Tax=Adineta ricciae TaxID=249248 RepID=A0A816AXJ3_ADIRI|nr:unnamed protein product [Adineta ricciae]
MCNNLTNVYQWHSVYCQIGVQQHVELFQRLKEEAIRKNKIFKPKRIVSDFELALVSAVHTEFPNSLHSGCYFHFLQAIHRNIANLGLASEYKENETIREQCRQLMALSLMPPAEVEKQFKRIRALSSDSLDDLFTYFQRQWINGNVPLTLWNANEYDDRTNNISEAFNRRFGSRIEKRHPNIWTFIRLIQDEEFRFERICIQLASGATNTKKSTTKIAFQRRFEALNNRYKQGEINSKQLLAGFTLL